MIPSKAIPWQNTDWRDALSGAIADVDTLARVLDLEPDALDWDAAPQFPLRVPYAYAARMKRGDPDDPLLLQVAPLMRERIHTAGYSVDPLHERSATLAEGLVQKYHGRVLLIAASSCAVNCRYCFRRHFPYDEHRHDRTFPMLDHIAADTSISEVILSGGDPLVMTDERLEMLLGRIQAIDHVKRIRIHTRLPVVIPQRINDSLMALLTKLDKPLVVVLHFNHANEVDRDAGLALAALNDAGITVLNQSVLLARVNDNVEALAQLSESLFEHGVLPYYLHLPDAVTGTAHFDVPRARARELFDKLQARLPGYLVPRMVSETAGASAKDLVF